MTHDLPHSVTAGSAFWRTVFGRDAPVEIEIGSGDGAFLTTRAAAFPARSLLGLERSPAKARRLAESHAELRTGGVQHDERKRQVRRLV